MLTASGQNQDEREARDLHHPPASLPSRSLDRRLSGPRRAPSQTPLDVP